MGVRRLIRWWPRCRVWAAWVFVVAWVFVAALFSGFTLSVDAKDSKLSQPKEASAKDAPGKEAPAKDAPAKDAPAKEAPAKEAPAKVVADTESIEARYRLGIISLSKNDSVAAASDFERVIEWNASHLGALVNLGWIAQRRQEWSQSESFMRRAVAVAPDNPAVWLGLGLAVLEQSKLDAAIAAFAQVVALDPKSARGHRFFGLALGRRGWVQAAEEELRRSLEIEPDDAGAHFNLAVFYLRRKPVAVELARRHYYRALDLGFEPDPALEESLKDAAEKPSALSSGKGENKEDSSGQVKSAGPVRK